MENSTPRLRWYPRMCVPVSIDRTFLFRHSGTSGVSAYGRLHAYAELIGFLRLHARPILYSIFTASLPSSNNTLTTPMHFSKTYTELLLSLPPELRNNAIEYRKLKKLINQVVRELTQLGACFASVELKRCSLLVQASPRMSCTKRSSSCGPQIQLVKARRERQTQRCRPGCPWRPRRTQ